MALLQPQMLSNVLQDAPDFMNELMTGTSIMATVFDGGVILGADSRTTSGTYIANRVSDKLTRVSDLIYCCRSGSAADTQAITDIVSYHVEYLSTELGQQPLVYTAANVFRDLCYSYRDSLMAGIIVAGYDDKLGGQIYCIPLGGMIKREKVAIGGSGSSYVYGYVDNHFRENMTKEECLQFTTNTLAHAMHRDGSSGGVVRMVVITKDGVERHLVKGEELPTIK